ncbi:MAG TPA: TolB-like translocation protein [Acidimicrobiia bacterium]|nr:TolB-like translocation protein [Acidimicrobiia bacterium]
MNETAGGRWCALGFVALAVVCVGTATGYVLHSKARVDKLTQAAALLPVAPPETVVSVAAHPHVLFRNTSTAAEAGFVALAPLEAPNGTRQITRYDCRRVAMAAGRGMCLAEQDDEPFESPYRARIFGPDFATVHDLPLAGLPSRARVSPDGRYGAATVFVSGDSYAPATFSTRTTLFDMAAGTSLGDLESFTAMKGGKRLQSVDFNYWGVTFTPDSNRFYATLGTGGHTYLVEGDVAGRRVTVLRDGVECPALSPDGTRIAFKSRVGGGGLAEDVRWRLSVMSLATLVDHPLAETRNVDDQAEWLDDGTILYGLGSDTWAVPADGTGSPSLFASRADSLVVVRTP